MRKFKVTLMAATLTLLASCGDTDPTAKTSPVAPSTSVASKTVKTIKKPSKPVIPPWNKSITDRASLVARLPQNVLLYARIPNVWGVLNAPKKNSLHAALSSDANQASTQKIQQGAATLIDREFGPLAPVIKLLSSSLRSPLEIAVSASEAGNPFSVSVVIEGKFAYKTLLEFNSALQQLATMHPLAQWIKGASEKEPGQIMVGPATLRFSYDIDLKQALLAGGLSLNPAQFSVIQAWEHNASHPIDGIEKRLDAERSGFMLWSNIELAAPLLKPMIPPHVHATLTELGVLSTQQLGLGFGTSEGKGRLLLSAGGNQGSVWSLSPEPLEMPSFKTTGEPDMVFAFTVPDYSWVERLFAEIAEQKGDAPGKDLDQANLELIKLTGVDLKTLVDGFSGSYFYVLDSNGSYVAHQGVKKIAWDSLLIAVEDKFKVTQTSKTVEGLVINHLVIPPVFSKQDPESDDTEMAAELKAFLSIIAAMNTHLYWIDEGGTRILAEVPQVLMDRRKYGADSSMSEWFVQQGLNFEHALLYLVANIDNVPRTNYYAYLKVLNALSDVFGQPLDLTEFQSARGLGLPNKGIFSAQIDYANQQLGAGLTYESHPGEMFYGAGGAMGGVAVVGILAAIAVPAYQDYVVRAEVGMAIAETYPLKQRLEQHFIENRAFPDKPEAQNFQSSVEHKKLQAIYFDVVIGGIVVEFVPNDITGEFATIHLLPQQNDQGVISNWQCSAEGGLTDKHLPPSCR